MSVDTNNKLHGCILHAYNANVTQELSYNSGLFHGYSPSVLLLGFNTVIWMLNCVEFSC